MQRICAEGLLSSWHSSRLGNTWRPCTQALILWGGNSQPKKYTSYKSKGWQVLWNRRGWRDKDSYFVGREWGMRRYRLTWDVNKWGTRIRAEGTANTQALKQKPSLCIWGPGGSQSDWSMVSKTKNRSSDEIGKQGTGHVGPYGPWFKTSEFILIVMSSHYGGKRRHVGYITSGSHF